MPKFTSETAVTAPHGFRTINGRKFGKRYGRKGGKARWAKMTEEEKALLRAKDAYSREQHRKATARLSKMHITAPKRLTTQEAKDIEEFFGDII